MIDQMGLVERSGLKERDRMEELLRGAGQSSSVSEPWLKFS